MSEQLNLLDTRARARAAIQPLANRLRWRVYRCIEGRGTLGATDEEVHRATGLSADTARARRIELRDAGLIRDSGMRRPSSSGHGMIVWTIFEHLEGAG